MIMRRVLYRCATTLAHYTNCLQSIRPICLPHESTNLEKYDDNLVHLIGWGSSQKNEKASSKLKRVVIQVYPLG